MSIANRPVKTVCKDCVFASYDPEDKQVGCQINRLERWCNQGVLTKNESHDSFVIERLCNTCRHKDDPWAEAYQTYDERLTQVRKEIQLRLTFVLWCDVPLLSGDFCLEEQLKQVAAQTVKPFEVHILNTHSKPQHKGIVDIAEDVLATAGIQYTVHTSLTENKPIHFHFNECLGKFSGTYLALFKFPFNIQNNFIEKIDYAYNVKLDEFQMLRAKDNQGLVINNKIVQLVRGYHPDEVHEGLIISDIAAKLEYIARIKNQQNLIKDLSDYV